MFLHGTSTINHNGHLEIGGVDSVELADQYGTPLFVYDVALIRKRAREFKSAFQKANVKGKVSYASKAFSSIALIQVIQEEKLYLDVASGGELYTAVTAGFPVEKIHFHGNNKSPEELRMALELRIGCIVVDNFHEIDLLERFCRELDIKATILIRVTPGITASTHDYIATGQADSKFGFDLHNGQAEEAIKLVLNSNSFELLGVHCHIGSQVIETDSYVVTVDAIFDHIKRWKDQIPFLPNIVNLGGGFGIRYTDQDPALPPHVYVDKIIEAVKSNVRKLNIKMPEVWIEPGRSLVGEAGTTLYRIGSQKEVPSIRTYLAIDGGMSDNLRPALYQAKYEAALANKMIAKHDQKVTVSGKCCESGDMLIWEVLLPETRPGDLLAVFCTGAYGYCMANNYNRLPKPAVVFVENGEAQLVIKRETYEDLVRLDLPYTTKARKKP
ncbi:diaminopimelate decarboxylase [Alkalihalobacillus sp. TS-13]|uniref:diaminopimelate decarboxylase n=1 Tax=Alkalihalobacillus sp. TS-13 TaxID=2842455 RepID=UPI001C86A5FF|nr:diaminopimelate decarboxylase [Alkalihalobacillus sp. TS-13]